jgi:uncharacterized damage-inducible protein DinB
LHILYHFLETDFLKCIEKVGDVMGNDATQMYEYNVWANKQIFARLKELPEDVYSKEVQSVFPSIASVLAHMYLAELSWLEAFLGERTEEAMKRTWEMQEETEMKSLEEMEGLFKDIADRYRKFLSNVENRVLESPLEGDTVQMNVEEVLPHIANHGTYHRGNISAMLHQLGHSSVMTDYVLYVYLQKKEAK